MANSKVPEQISNIINKLHGLDKQKPLVEGVDYILPTEEQSAAEPLSQEFIDLMRKRSKELTKTKGVENMLGNPIMSSVFKKNPKRNQTNPKSEESTDTSVNETKEKPVSKKDPLINYVAPDSEVKLKAGDSEGNILGKIFNLMVEKYHNDDANFKEETKYKEKLKEKKETRSQELIDLFTPGKKKTRKTSKKEKKEKEEKGTAEKVEPKSTGTAKSGTTSVASKVNKPPTGGFSSAATAGVAIAGGLGLAAAASSVIAKEEGVVTKAMWDPPGQKTLVALGYGHQIQPEEYAQGFIQVGDERVLIKGERGIDTTITKEQAQKLLKEDTPKYEKRAADPLGSSWNKLNDQQKSALISYAYNTGSTASLVKQGLKQAIDSGDMELAASIIRDKGIKTASGKYLKQLDDRRHREASLFLSGPSIQQPKAPPAPVPAQTTPQSIPDKIPSNQSAGAPSTTIISKTTNVIKGGTTYSITEDNSPDTSPLIDRQYNLR